MREAVGIVLLICGSVAAGLGLGWKLWGQRSHCQHRWVAGIYGDDPDVRDTYPYRLRCVLCGHLLKGSISEATTSRRKAEELDMGKQMSPQEFASRVDWEGGVLGALLYGLRSEDLSNADPALRTAWQSLEVAWDSFQPWLAKVQAQLDEIEK